MSPLLIGLFVGLGITAGWFVTEGLTRFCEWLERRR